MQADLAELERRLWDAAEELRANSGLRASEYSAPDSEPQIDEYVRERRRG